MSNDWIELTADDGHTFRAWRSLPPEEPLGAVVVLPEIFGVNRHMRWVAEQVSAHGYAAYVPNLLDRVNGPLDLGYSDADRAVAEDCAKQIGFDLPLRDIAATAAVAESHGPVGVIGFSFGGTLAWRCAHRLGLPAIGYYGTRSGRFIDETPQSPVLLHVGERDPGMPRAEVDAIAARHPGVVIHPYAAGHGFNCNERADFHAESAALAWRRTFAFLREHLTAAPRFSLHPTLARDCVVVGELPLCQVLLMDDARYPWLILVPRIRHAREIIDLSAADQHRLIDDVARASAALRDVCDPTKLNVAAIGNRVPQLHVHVVARFEGDAAWPDPVWGRGEREAYGEGPKRMLIRTLRSALKLADAAS